MKRIILLILLIIPLSNGFGQEFYMGMQTGMGWYKMEELKYFSSGIMKSNPLEPYLIEDYPPFLYYQPYLSVQWKLMEVGLSYSFQSTGSRYSVKDYSGIYYFDTRIHSEGPGILFNLRLIPVKGFHISWYNEIGFLRTKMTLDESLVLDDQEYFDESYHFTATNSYWEPGIKVEYPLNLFLFELNMGYALHSDGKGLEYQGANFEGFLQVSGVNVHPGWSGLRLGLSAAVNLTSLKNRGQE